LMSALPPNVMNSRRLMASPAPRTPSGIKRISHFGSGIVPFVIPKQAVAMSALGQKQTCRSDLAMSALPLKADIDLHDANVRLLKFNRPQWHEAHRQSSERTSSSASGSLHPLKREG
jgi:hypothetical protein